MNSLECLENCGLCKPIHRRTILLRLFGTKVSLRCEADAPSPPLFVILETRSARRPGRWRASSSAAVQTVREQARCAATCCQQTRRRARRRAASSASRPALVRACSWRRRGRVFSAGCVCVCVFVCACVSRPSGGLHLLDRTRHFMSEMPLTFFPFQPRSGNVRALRHERSGF